MMACKRRELSPADEACGLFNREPAVVAFADLFLALYSEQSWPDVAHRLDALRQLGFEVKPTAQTYYAGGRIS